MSIPKAPFYFKDGNDTYHWEFSCTKNHYPNSGWKKINSKPGNKEQCNECRSK